MRLAVFVVALLVLHVAMEGRAAACDRASTPLEDPIVATAVADAIAVVEIKTVGGGTALADVKTTLKGALKQGDAIPIKGLFTEAEGARHGMCGLTVADVGKRYIVLLWNPARGATAYDLVEPATSVLPYDVEAEAGIAKAIAKQHPHSTWELSRSEILASLVLDTQKVASPGDVDLFVLLRNVGKAAVNFTYKSWPLAEQSKCALRIVDSSNSVIGAQRVPIPKQDIADYFSKNGRTYQLKMNPGEAHVLFLQRVTTAAQGWGYKEELGFQFYPVALHGGYTVTANCTNLFGPGSQITTGTLNVNL